MPDGGNREEAEVDTRAVEQCLRGRVEDEQPVVLVAGVGKADESQVAAVRREVGLEPSEPDGLTSGGRLVEGVAENPLTGRNASTPPVGAGSSRWKTTTFVVESESVGCPTKVEPSLATEDNPQGTKPAVRSSAR